MKTTDLENELRKAGDFNEGMIENNAPPELHILLNRYIDDKNLSKADVIRKLNIDRNYGYQILKGSRIPTRNCLLQLSLILGLDEAQISELLRLAGKTPLYVRNVVDARVFYAVNHNMDYFEAIDFIWGGSIL